MRLTIPFGYIRWTAFALVSLAVAGCEVTRPPSVTCTGLTNGLGNDLLPVSQSKTEIAMTEMVVETMERAARVDRRGPVTLNVLSLSSGGQYGAFGAGFLRGWSENADTPRPSFDLVTGVSAGSMLAPIAFAGTEFDAALDVYRGLEERQVYRRYPLISAPFSASIATSAPLQNLLQTQMTDALINRIASRHQDEKAQLLASAVNLDSTENRVFNLGATAGTNAPMVDRRDCMTEVMLASSAVPALFPPRHIDGALYADGGLRDHVFFRAVESARAQVARDTGRDVRIDATIIINGALVPPSANATDTLSGYLGRSAEILADEVLRDSIVEAIAFAEAQPGWQLRGMFSEVDFDGADCVAEQESGTFDPCITRTLFDGGRALAREVPIRWKSADELRQKANEL